MMFINSYILMGVVATLTTTVKSCATNGICGGAPYCQQPMMMAAPVQCQCPPSYGCGQYGCYKLRARASKNIAANDGETAPSLSSFRRFRGEYSRESAERTAPLKELDERTLMANDPPTRNHLRGDLDLPANPNEAFLSCCMDRQLPDACLQKCNFHSYTKQVLTTMYFKQDACPFGAMKEMQFCAAQGRDHRQCCARNGVTTTIAGAKCLVFCDQRPGIITQLDMSYLSCFDRFENMKSCFWHDVARFRRYA